MDRTKTSSGIEVKGSAVPALPWRERPEGSREILWRYGGNPVIGWNPVPGAARVYNSAGPVPIETSEGWLLFYHGVCGTCNGFVYSIGAALLDLECPSKVLYRSRDYLLTPETPYETSGFVPNVCFPCAALCDAPSGRLAIYYGAADTHSALAFGRVDEVVAFVKANSELVDTDSEDWKG